MPALLVVPVSAMVFVRLVPIHARRSRRAPAGLGLCAVGRYAVADYAGAMFALALVTLLPLVITRWAGSAENAIFYQA